MTTPLIFAPQQRQVGSKHGAKCAPQLFLDARQNMTAADLVTEDRNSCGLMVPKRRSGITSFERGDNRK